MIGFSRGGETDEIIFIANIARKRGSKVIGVIENVESSFAKICDIVLVGSVQKKYEPIETVPLLNTIIQAILGDILCLAVNRNRGIDSSEFGFFHPGGAVGKRLNT